MLFCPAFTNSFMDRPQELLDAIFATNFSAKSFYAHLLMSFFSWRKNGRFLF